MRGGYSRVGRGEEAGEEVAERGGHSRVMIYDDEEGGGIRSKRQEQQGRSRKTPGYLLDPFRIQQSLIARFEAAGPRRSAGFLQIQQISTTRIV